MPYGVIFTALFWMVSLLSILFSGRSALHLLWLFPIGLLFSFLGMLFPFTLVVVPAAKVYASIWMLGLNRHEVARNTALHNYLTFRVISLGGATSDENKRTVREELEKHRGYIIERMIELQSQGYGEGEATDKVALEVAEREQHNPPEFTQHDHVNNSKDGVAREPEGMATPDADFEVVICPNPRCAQKNRVVKEQFKNAICGKCGTPLSHNAPDTLRA